VARLPGAPLGLALLTVALAAPLAAGAAGPAAKDDGHPVRLHDRTVATLTATLDGASPSERARAATDALARAFEAGGADAHVVLEGDRAAVWLGDVPVLALGPDDVAAAGARDAAALAGAVAAQVQRSAAEERRRAAASDLVYAASMLVFSGLVAFLLARKVGMLALAAAVRIESGEVRVPAAGIAGVELASATFVRGTLPLAIRLGRVVVYLVAAYAWLLFSASLFEATGPVGERLTRVVATPAAQLASGLADAIPVLILLALGVAVVALVLRAASLHFEAVGRGEVASPWIPRELARPTGALVRAGIVALALVFAPAFLGLRADRGLGGLAWAALLALGLGASPLAAALAVGVAAVYGRTLRPGDEAEVAGRRGRVREVTLLAVTLEDEEGGTVHVPHLATLIHPTRVRRGGGGRPA
jgi:small-conductance mechanosensitive channel